METIINYLENMFKNLPNTHEMLKLKEEILSNMEDKYYELKNSGKTENEAIGIVISEFGNIDELMEAYDIKKKSDEKSLPSMTEEEINDFLDENKKSAKMIGFGVFLSIIASAILVLSYQLIDMGIVTFPSTEFGNIAGLIPFFLFITVAVILFIYAGLKIEKYKHIEYGVEIDSVVQHKIQQKNEAFHSSFVRSIVTGVTLIILSPLTLIILSAFRVDYGVVFLLLMVAVGVYMIVYSGMVKDGYKKLVKIEKYSMREKEQNRVIAAANSIIWPLALCIFLITGFLFEMWGINWIIFPITALLFATFSGAYKILKSK
ncbi:hypothetical protein SAMN05421676_10273 [Salinibacillus kushneri]|uniref:Uncharacterized protein n=1 Tax=Salinibacillus kushneri TaxID=237682 RepID=A0A1I0A8L5_9BACI|nr:permease prefix domain 1-containing protein [Salinibacillus kushneri]SES90514.1 hypothetical protein SAMN05421676_10273 [Salinibacillus kushneri]